ncbi:hypothetical protein ACH40F_51555 [Streptomyces sp. NPDC020794]|uniref:hypothetical protein n=1 Tax=unclassified Streptomyces TaxID=2593676 RepID=UPI0036E87CD0
MRTFIAGPDRDQLGFAVCSTLTDHTRATFSAWLRVRRHERGESSDLAHRTSVGVLLTPRTDGYREWDTTVMAVSGDPELTGEKLSAYQDLFTTPNSPAGADTSPWNVRARCRVERPYSYAAVTRGRECVNARGFLVRR